MKKLAALLIATMLFAGLAMPAAAQKNVTIGVSVPVLANPFWRAFADFAVEAGEALGARVIVVDANQNDANQLNQIQGLISQGVDGMVITPNSSAIARSLLRQADRAGIPVVIAERYPGFSPDEYSGSSYVGFVGVDNTLAGYNIAKALYEAGARKIVANGGVPGGAVADERHAGLKKFLDEHPDMILLQELRNAELREHGLANAENFLSAFPGPAFEGIWNYNDDVALGSMQALRNAGVLSKVGVGGMDLIPEAVAAIEKGEMLFSTGGQWAESAMAVVMVYDAIHGKAPTHPVLELALPNVTKENVDAYKAQFIESTPEYDFRALSQVYNPDAKNTDFSIEMK